LEKAVSILREGTSKGNDGAKICAEKVVLVVSCARRGWRKVQNSI